MPDNDGQPTDFDWRLTSFEGSRREQLRRWAQLPLEHILLAIEEMEDITRLFASTPSQNGESPSSGQSTQPGE